MSPAAAAPAPAPAAVPASAPAVRTYELGFWRLTWRRLCRNSMGVTGLVIVGALLVTGFLAPVLANNKPIYMRYKGKAYFPALAEQFPFSLVIAYPELTLVDFEELKHDARVVRWMPPVPNSPYQTHTRENFQSWSSRYWFGTDDLGRDNLARVIHGARVSLTVGFVAMGIATFLGILVGALAGYYGGWTDVFLSRVIEVVTSFPTFFLIIAIVAFLPPRFVYVMIVIGLTNWTGIARYTRGEFLRLKELEFAVAGRALGAADGRIIFRHILPNALAPVLVSVSFGIANAILIEAGLSFLGFGVPPPTPSWGGMLSRAQEYIEYWWFTVFPGLAIFLAVTGYNLLGEGLRDATDPRAAKR